MTSYLFKTCLTSVVALFLSSLFSPATALSIIRDAETESALHALANPIFTSARLHPEDVDIIVVNDPALNAFVAEGMHLFIHTGLLLEMPDANAIIGVLAHETGHIAGGHLARNSERFKDIALQSILTYLAGAAAAVGGSPDAGIAIIQGGGHIAERAMLQFSRQNENSADQAALTFLDRNHLSSAGFLALLERLNREETIMYGTLNPYVLTHPLSRQRIEHIRHHLEDSPFKNRPVDENLQQRYQRARIKLLAFLQPADKTLRLYGENNVSPNAQYARAIAYYKQPDTKKALSLMDTLITQYPEDPYFVEFKGQILFEAGQIKDALPAYQRAAQRAPQEPLILLGLAITHIAYADKISVEKSPSHLRTAITHLDTVLRHEPDNITALEQLVVAHGKLGHLGEAHFYQAQKALLLQNNKDAIAFAKKAASLLPKGSPLALRVQDILETTKAK